MSDKKPVVGRRDFIRNLMIAGFQYDQAVAAYQAMMSTIATGVCNGQAVYFGNVGCITPVTCLPRKVNMGCMKKAGGEVLKIKREYFLDTRLKYKFRLFEKFLSQHQLAWHSS